MIDNALVDRTVKNATPLTRFQFERLGYFCVDFDSTKDQVCLYYVLSVTSYCLPGNLLDGIYV